MSNFTPDAAAEQEARQLLKRLARLKHKWPSEPALRDLSPQMVNTLLNNAAFLTKTKFLMPTLMAELTFFVCMAIFTLFAGSGSVTAGNQIVYVALLAVFVWGAAFWHELKKARRDVVYALTQTEDMRVLPTLIKATSEKWGMHPEVIRAIKRLLPQVTEQQAGLLGREAQERLWYFAVAPIRYESGDEALACSALGTLARVGNREMLTKMRYFARSNTSNAAYGHVNVLIRQLTPVMTARLQRQEVPATLLRASDTPTASPDILLRPATPTEAEPAEQLLRAATSEASENER